MQVLVDYHMEGQGRLLYETLRQQGWADLLKLEFVYFTSVGLAPDSDDTLIWRRVQTHGMLLLTDNRNSEDETALAAAIKRENTPSSLPVLTVGTRERLNEPEYRRDAAYRLAEIIFDIENYRGTGRIFIP